MPTDTKSPLLLARQAAGLSIMSAARKVGLSQSTVSYLERGVTDPRISTARLFARLYGKPLDELFPAPPTKRGASR